jgi:Tlde1 domain
MLKPFAMVTAAAGIAAAITFGLEQQSPALSARASHAEESGASPAARNADGQEQGVAGESVTSASLGAPNEGVSQQEAALANSPDTAANYVVSGPFARWNALVLFDTSRLGISNTTEAPRRETTDNQPELASNDEAAPPFPKARPTNEKSAPIELASATQVPDAVAKPQAPSILDSLQNIFRFQTSPFPAEASGRTAVYDLETRAVYMPTGEILEAHSGLGEHMDDIRYVQEKGRGPTPPNVYALTLREKSFHGVQAIRLNPVGKSNMFGRAGILAHPYMMGPNGDSNGCVSIQNYPKFLEAYLNGQIERLIVVPRLTATSEILNASQASSSKRAAL